jgi:2-methylcitrate dehydratase PrpD
VAEPSGATRRLAAFIAETTADQLSAAAWHEAKRSILNFFATAVAGCGQDAIEISLKSITEFSAADQATVIGRTERIDTLGAAFLNAASSNVFDFDDTHLQTVIHPAGPVASALFALAERQRVGGRDFLLAFALGVEVECRLGIALSPKHYTRGWHITSTCGVFGAAVAAAKVLRLDTRQIISAIGAAATQSAGLVECLGTSAKSISVGNAARNGLWSALLAQGGLHGPAAPLEGTQGYFSAMGEILDPTTLTSELGKSWELLQNTYKPYPCGIVVHPVIDAILTLRAEPSLTPDAIERIVVRGNPLLSQRTDRPHVTTGREAQVSTQHSVAVALLFGKAGLQEYTDACVQDAGVRSLRSRVVMERDPAIPAASAIVRIFTRDGREHGTTIDHAYGSAQRPMTDQDLEKKLRELAVPVLGERKPGDLIDAVWSLEKRDDASEVLRFAVPEAA